MNTFDAFARGAASRGRERKVFDWDKAARLIAERRPREAAAGLASDWEWTGGTIYENGAATSDHYTYLASTWATPELDLDGDVIDCFRMETETPGWDEDTKWPESALAILNAGVNS